MNKIALLICEFWKYKKDLYFAIRLRVSVYAILLTYLSFFLHNNTASQEVVLLTALAFALASASIQVFNDFIDRECDKQKGKIFASNHSKLIFNFWQIINLVVISVLILLSLVSVKLAIVCLLTWILGIAYSLLQKVFLLQNIIVATCGSIPALASWIYFSKPEPRSIIIFLILFFLNIVREIIKDIQDRATDLGYKLTLPIATANKINTAEDVIMVFRRRLYPKNLYPLDLMLCATNPSTFPSIDTCCYILCYISLLSLCLGYPGFIVSIMIATVALRTLYCVSTNPDRYALKTKRMINTTMFVLIFLMFFT
jgi:4-hydroxybenzoate polyprenyltransferase